MDESQRLKLNTYIKANNVEDQTDFIRELKHSNILKLEIARLVDIVKEENGNEFAINERGSLECHFLFMYYTDIYNKVRKEEIDLTIMAKFLDVLEKIENCELDQHEGSYMVGELLKKIYVDSALRKAEKLNRKAETENDENESESQDEDDVVKISYKEFKDISKIERVVSKNPQTVFKK